METKNVFDYPALFTFEELATKLAATDWLSDPSKEMEIYLALINTFVNTRPTHSNKRAIEQLLKHDLYKLLKPLVDAKYLDMFNLDINSWDKTYEPLFLTVGSPKYGRSYRVMMHGHVDLIDENIYRQNTFDQFKPFILDNKLIGRGTNDMYGGLVAMIMAIFRLYHKKIQPSSLGFIITGDEEIGSPYAEDSILYFTPQETYIEGEPGLYGFNSIGLAPGLVFRGKLRLRKNDFRTYQQQIASIKEFLTLAVSKMMEENPELFSGFRFSFKCSDSNIYLCFSHQNIEIENFAPIKAIRSEIYRLMDEAKLCNIVDGKSDHIRTIASKGVRSLLDSTFTERASTEDYQSHLTDIVPVALPAGSIFHRHNFNIATWGSGQRRVINVGPTEHFRHGEDEYLDIQEGLALINRYEQLIIGLEG